MRYTIEARQLTSQHAHRPSGEANPRQTIIEARDPDDAITQFIRENHSELVSLTQPTRGESIATVKKDDSMFLVRVYAG